MKTALSPSCEAPLGQGPCLGQRKNKASCPHIDFEAFPDTAGEMIQRYDRHPDPTCFLSLCLQIFALHSLVEVYQEIGVTQATLSSKPMR